MVQEWLCQRHVRKPSPKGSLRTRNRRLTCADNGCARDMPEVMHPGR